MTLRGVLFSMIGAAIGAAVGIWTVNRDGIGASGYACGYADGVHLAAYGTNTDFAFCEPYRRAAKERNFP